MLSAEMGALATYRILKVSVPSINGLMSRVLTDAQGGTGVTTGLQYGSRDRTSPSMGSGGTIDTASKAAPGNGATSKARDPTRDQ